MGYPPGRPRKPPELRAVGAGESEPAYEIPEAPGDLQADEFDAWNDLRAAINPKRVTTAADIIAFRLTVQALTVARRAYNELSKGIIATGDKMDRPSPAASIMASQQKLAWHGLSRFGLTPADRSRVRADGPTGQPEQNPEDEFGA